MTEPKAPKAPVGHSAPGGHSALAALNPAMVPHHGWYLPAFRSELVQGFTPLAIGNRRLMALREGDSVRIFDSTCPHRGANLAVGGRRDGDCVVCPFHGRKVHLGDTGRRYGVGEHRVALWGDAVFVRLGGDLPDGHQDDDDRGFAKALGRWAGAYPLVPALTRQVAAAGELIVENAFDADHFHALHNVPRVAGMVARTGRFGELEIDGEFRMITSPWQDMSAKAEALWTSAATGVVKWTYRPRFHARAFSPNLVVTEFGPEGDVHIIVTASVPTEHGCAARVAVGVAPGREDTLEQLIAGSHRAIGEDVSVWENLDPGHKPRYDVRDRPILAFREFCDGFRRLG